jgi:hypothetical protein
MYYSYVYPDYLAHYGVQGMKWGQHIYGKDSSSGRSSRSTTSTNSSSGNKTRGNLNVNVKSTVRTATMSTNTANYLAKNKFNREAALSNARNDRSATMKNRLKQNAKTALSVGISSTIATANPVVGITRGVGTVALMSVLDAGVVHASYGSVIKELKNTSDENIKTLESFANIKNAASKK